MDILLEMGLVAIMGAAATVAGAAEDLESDIGSQSNPNSQVQLAPQMNKPHRIYNKAISGEPPAYGLWCSSGAVVTSVLIGAHVSPLMAIAVGAFMGSIALGLFAVTPYIGRSASQRRYKQPIYLDVIRNHLFGIMGHGYLAIFCILIISYIMHVLLDHPFPIPLLALIWGITVGAIASSTGDVHYGSEREFQNYEFGTGLNAANSGDIVRRAEAGLRSSIDNAWFCAKYGGPATGLTFGLTVFIDNWRTTLLHPTAGLGWYAVALGAGVVLLTILLNRAIELHARNTFGPYKEDTTEATAEAAA